MLRWPRWGRELRVPSLMAGWLTAWLTLAVVDSLRAAVFSTNVNQRLNGGTWNLIGTFRFCQGGEAEYVEINNSVADGFVIADAVMFRGAGATNILDDADGVNTSNSGGWTSSSATAGYYGTGYKHDGDARGSPLKWWRFKPAVAQAGDYTVYVRWTAYGNRATLATLAVLYDVAPVEHDLVVQHGSGGGRYYPNTRVPVAADAPPVGMEFRRWTSAGGGWFDDPFSPQTVFHMPASNVVIEATYRLQLGETWVRQSERLLPIVTNVDVVIAGSTVGALGMAVGAAQTGASVMLLSPGFYLGQDFVGENRAWLEPGENPVSALALHLFGARTNTNGFHFVVPAQFKRLAEQALDARGVLYLFNTHAVEVLVDAQGELSGVVIANKDGRQAVPAKVLVDATPMAGLAQIAGAPMEPWPTQQVTLSRTAYRNATGGVMRGDYCESVTNLLMAGGTWVDRCRAEAWLRRMFDTGSASWTAQFMHLEEPRAIIGQAQETSTPWIGAANVNLDVCRPAGVSYLLVIGSACAVARAHTASLLRPLELLALGERLGARAATDAAARSVPTGLRVRMGSATNVLAGLEVAELLSGHRPFVRTGRVPQEGGALPVMGDYDVVVVGGGAAGACAAVGAARRGARVLCLEQLGLLGGTGVNGIGRFWRGYRQGFAVEYSNYEWKPNGKAHWFRRELEKAGGEVWYNTLACGVLKSNQVVRGVVVATPLGRLAVLGRVVIDATGDADICAAAGAEFLHNQHGDFAQQESGFHADTADPSGYQNNSWLFVDPTDVDSTTLFHALARRYSSMATDTNKWDHYPLLGVRESRMVRGDYVVTGLDQFRQRTYADTIAQAESDFDNHGYFSSKASYAGLIPYGESYIPYRALLPRGLENLFVVGRCKSVEHDALPLSRMQSDVGNEGYAAGHAAALAVEAGVGLRQVNLAVLQAHLKTIGNLPANCPLVDLADPTDAELQGAADNPGNSNQLARLLVDEARSLPFLRAGFATAPDKAKALALCFLGDTNGVTLLADWLDTQALGTGNGYSSRVVTEVDSAIRALGYARDARAVPALARKLGVCGTGANDFSHARALALALGDIASPEAVPALVNYLRLAGVTNQARRASQGSTAFLADYKLAVQEVLLAAALWRCGDTNGLARSLLESYQDDWRGPLRRYALETLGRVTSARGVPAAWFPPQSLAAANPAVEERLDSDGDGQADWAEYWAGTCPSNRADVLRITALAPDGTLAWRGGSNEFNFPYQVLRTPDLAQPWRLCTNLNRAPAGTQSWRDPEAGLFPRFFYRLATPTAP